MKKAPSLTAAPPGGDRPAPDGETLREALMAALSCYDLQPDLDGLLAQLPRSPGPLRVGDLPAILEKLGVPRRQLVLEREALQQAGLPAIVLYKDGSAGAFLPTFGPQGRFAPDTDMPIRGCVLLDPPAPRTGHDTGHMVTAHSLDWFWLPIKANKRQYIEIIVCSVFMNMLVLAMPLFSMNVYDRVAVNFSETTLDVLAFGVLMALGFDFFFRTTRAYILDLVSSKTSEQFDMILMERLMSLRGPGLTLSLGERANLFRELQGIKDFYAGRLAPAVADLPFFFFFLAVIALISPLLAAIPFVAAIVILLINFAMTGSVNRASQHNFASTQGKSAFLIQTLAGMDTIRMLGARGTKLFQWSLASGHAIEASRHNNMTMTVATNLCIFVSYLVNVLVIFAGVHEISEGQLTVGGVVAASMLSSRAVAPMVSFSGMLSRLKQTGDVLKTIDRIFRLPHESEDAALSPKGPLKGKIQLSNVSFAYPQQPTPALDNVTLTIEAGERVGIIGRTGAGKSTLARVVCRFLDPVAGTVKIDGFDANGIPPEEWRRTIGYVPQDGFFFSGTMRANILLGQEEIDPAALVAATRISGLDVIMQGTGRGLDMEIGEGGSRLSGGQRQAIAIARTVVRDPRIIVFDEPINGVDNALEASIKQELGTWLHGRTFVMITHRTSLLSLVDRLILVERGRIVADGPRDEIVRKLGGGA